MRSNAMKSCAVGAMLIGGVLGANSAASAAVTFTWMDSFNGTSTNFLIESEDSPGALTSGSIASSASNTLTDGGASATFTNTALGFSIGGTGSAIYVGAYRYLTISGLGTGQTATASFTLSSSLSSSGLIGGIQTWNPNSPGGAAWDPTPIVVISTGTVQLGNGTYAVSLTAGSDLGDISAFSLGNGSPFASFTVPAPGAIALLGAAGLMGRRRRN